MATISTIVAIAGAECKGIERRRRRRVTTSTKAIKACKLDETTTTMNNASAIAPSMSRANFRLDHSLIIKAQNAIDGRGSLSATIHTTSHRVRSSFHVADCQPQKATVSSPGSDLLYTSRRHSPYLEQKGDEAVCSSHGLVASMKKRGRRQLAMATGASSIAMETGEAVVKETNMEARGESEMANETIVAADFLGVDGVVLTGRKKKTGDGGRRENRYHIHTFGCQMNSADSERMAGILESAGYVNEEDPNFANLIIYNTCSIRDKSEQKVYSALGRQKWRKKDEPGLKIVVAGCVAQQEGERLLRRVPEVDLVMGPQHANRLQELLDQVDQGSQVCATEPIHILEDITKPRRSSNVTAWVNVIYGCNERCTYCVVPGVRGVEQSREPEAIKQEMICLGEAGFKEVTLLGQNIDAYGRDLPGSAQDGSGRRLWTFTDLLQYVHDVPGIERIRFATSHPRYFTERLIKTCATLPKVCKYFHIPFQSGDNEILKAMARGYTRERYVDILDRIRNYMPDAALSTDVIVGFPGETEEQFQSTINLLEEIGFDQVNSAAYSPRPSTPAATWDNQVADLVKEDRLHRLNRLVLDQMIVRNQKYVGRTEKILVEGVNVKQEGQVFGRTDGNRLTFFSGRSDLIGQIVNVRITQSRAVSLTGDLID